MSAGLAPRERPAVAAVSVRPAAADDAAAWDRYVEAHAEATFFHLWGWRSVIERAFAHATHYLLAERAGRLTGVLPLGRLKSRLFGHSLISMPFGVYGGILAADEPSRTALQAAACELAHRLEVDYLELRHRDRPLADWPAKSLYVTFRKQIAADDEQNLRAIPKKQRAMVRKGIAAGLESHLDESIDRFFAIYSQSVRNLGTPVYAKRYFQILREVFGRRCEILTVTAAGTPVASVLSFYFRDEVLPYYGGGTASARDLKANDFMYWSLMCHAARRGVRVFDYGRSKEATGSYRFKKHWGFEPQPLHYQYYLVNAPEIPNVSPANPKYRLMIALWKRLPLPLARTLGPLVARHLG